jgi:NADH-quinone oxidoreductase subunit N
VNYSELLRLAAPEAVLVGTALVVLALGLWKTHAATLCSGAAAAGLLFAASAVLLLPPEATFANGMLVITPLICLFKIVCLALAFFTVILARQLNTPHHGEYLGLLLLATVGLMLLVGSEELLVIFIGLELTGLSLYVMAAFDKDDRRSAEAGLKYFLFGSTASAFTLFGLSLVYGMCGTTGLAAIGQKLTAGAIQPLLFAGIVMTLIGFAFKIAAAPFHLWAPDAYEGAPTPSAAFIASGSKVAGFFIFAKVMSLGFDGAQGSGGWRAFQPGWVPVIGVVAAASMLLGNLTAIVQSSVRRLLAYSAIAHAGYMLLGIMAGQQSFASLTYYVITYALTTIGAFAVVALVQEGNGGDRFGDFAGLSRRAPVAAFSMMIFMLSLAGIPPLAGFFGKFYLFASAVTGGAKNLGLLWLVILAIGMSAVSLYYYLKVLKQIYIAEPSGVGAAQRSSVLSQVVIAVIAVLVVLLGCFPNIIISRLTEVVKLAAG